MTGESTNFDHAPVMVGQVKGVFEALPQGNVVDATVGGGGHARALLEAHPQLTVIGLDQDDQALAAAATTLARFGSRVILRRARFDQLSVTLQELGNDKVAGVLFDLGVSSPQLDHDDRGFSYRSTGPLDMRMDRRQDKTAESVVNDLSASELARVLSTYGDERFANRIAAAIVAARPLTDTRHLAEVVTAAIPAAARRRGGHPATRTFQAIRIAVNDELAVLESGLEQAIDALEPEGILAVLAYHSGEDRIVKRVLRHGETGGCTCPPDLPCVCGATPTLALLWRGAHRPESSEVAANPRARSARLRAARRLAPGPERGAAA